MKFPFIIITLLLTSEAFAQGYKIDIHVSGYKDTTAYLGYYLGDETYIKDTARVDHQGKCSFNGKAALPEGVYFYALNKTRNFDFIVSEQQYFSLETSKDNFILNMKVSGDPDNELYFGNMMYIAELQKQAEPLIKVLGDGAASEEKKKNARKMHQAIVDKAIARQGEIIEKHPKTLTARMLKLNNRITVPDPQKKANGAVDTTFGIRYYRKHFFDNFDLADPAMLRLPQPYYQQKLDEYLDKLFFQTPDSLMIAIDGIAIKAKKNHETYQYLVWNCLTKYQNPATMGLDEVYVRLIDKYFLSGEMDFWANDGMKRSLRESADKLRASLLGKKGANLNMPDKNFQLQNLYDIKKKYTILYFFDPDCGHCRVESPRLVEFYNKSKVKYDLEVYAVSLDTSMQKMRDYIQEMKMSWITVNGPRNTIGSYKTGYFAETTPTIYILDEKKKIVAKWLSVEKIEDFLNSYNQYLLRKSNIKG